MTSTEHVLSHHVLTVGTGGFGCALGLALLLIAGVILVWDPPLSLWFSILALTPAIPACVAGWQVLQSSTRTPPLNGARS